jgi:transposase-like protein
LFRKQHIFLRSKKPLWLKIQSVIDYALGLSYRKIKNKIKSLYGIDVALSAIYRWIKTFQERIRIDIESKERKQIAIDETVIKICGYKCFLWAAIDIHSKELIAFDFSAGRSELDTRVMLGRIKARCKEDLPIIITDKGP